MKMEKFTPLAKNLHCHQQWRHGQIPPLCIVNHFSDAVAASPVID